MEWAGSWAHAEATQGLEWAFEAKVNLNFLKISYTVMVAMSSVLARGTLVLGLGRGAWLDHVSIVEVEQNPPASTLRLPFVSRMRGGFIERLPVEQHERPRRHFGRPRSP